MERERLEGLKVSVSGSDISERRSIALGPAAKTGMRRTVMARVAVSYAMALVRRPDLWLATLRLGLSMRPARLGRISPTPEDLHFRFVTLSPDAVAPSTSEFIAYVQWTRDYRSFTD